MFSKERKDGTYIRNINFFTQITPYIKPARTDSVIIFEDEYDLTNTLNYMRDNNLSFMQVFLYAALRAITMMPKTNRFISGLRFYQRNKIVFAFPTNSDTNENSSSAESFSPLLTFEKFCDKFNSHSSLTQKTDKPENQKIQKLLLFIQKLPRFLIRFLIKVVKYLDYHNGLPATFTNLIPYFSSMIITNTDNLEGNINATYYHNFDIGTCGIFCTIGKMYEINDRKKIKMNFSYDARITSPDYFSQFLIILRNFSEEPWKLESPPEWTTEQLVKLGLSEKELNNI